MNAHAPFFKIYFPAVNRNRREEISESSWIDVPSSSIMHNFIMIINCHSVCLAFSAGKVDQTNWKIIDITWTHRRRRCCRTIHIEWNSISVGFVLISTLFRFIFFLLIWSAIVPIIISYSKQFFRLFTQLRMVFKETEQKEPKKKVWGP